MEKTRREFLKKMMASTVALSLAPLMNSCGSLNTKGIPQRALGKTGRKVGIYSFGAQATTEIPGKSKESVEIINRAIDLGINYIDTAAAYGRATETIVKAEAMGTSERNVGQVLKTRRNEVFLASKTHDRTYDGSMRLLEQSLKNLQTDHLDLWQIHNVKKREIDTLDEMFTDTGVIKAMEKARDEGMVKFIGCTGHEDAFVLKTLIERYPFDNILMAVNAADKHYDSFIDKLMPTAVEKNMGIVAMKIPARDRIFSHGGIITMKEAMEYVMTLPVSTTIIGIDTIAELEENVKIATEFSALSADEMLAIEDKTHPYYEDLMFFKGLSDWPADW
ncbi:MAG: aldo/keto reductase [Bacteroidales bacterium]|nr:aldo/keto reductase [Bacteroidales bacterium]MCF8392173.1 aldo/keto reductase [Bacteroidales bacterium]